MTGTFAVISGCLSTLLCCGDTHVARNAHPQRHPPRPHPLPRSFYLHEVLSALEFWQFLRSGL